MGNGYDKKLWEREIDIMRDISNVGKTPSLLNKSCVLIFYQAHIVRLRSYKKTPRPVLYLEYMPFGNLENAHRRSHFSPGECLQIFYQSLSALVYLHGRPKPIAHRDIKPENILVEYRDPNRDPNYLRIKLLDFGLSKTGAFKTFCGSDTYLPPEVDSSLRRSYTEAVDIWSLGVVMLRFAYAFPRPGHGIGMRWCEKIVEKAHDRDSDGLIEILRRMLVIEPRARPSAAECLHEASRLLALFQDRSATPTPASYAAEYGAAMAYQEEQETLRISPYEVCSRKQSFN